MGQLQASDFQSELKGPLCAQVLGFSLHAAVHCAPHEREKLEKLCRYVTRPAVAEDRLKLQPNGDILLRLKNKYSDGTSHLLFSGLEFVEKLAAITAPPRIHLTRFFGCLAPNSKIRSQIVPKKPQTESIVTLASSTDQESTPPKRSRRMGWAELLARVFAIDMQSCPNCPGELKMVSAIIEFRGIQSDQTNTDPPWDSRHTPGHRSGPITPSIVFRIKPQTQLSARQPPSQTSEAKFRSAPKKTHQPSPVSKR